MTLRAFSYGGGVQSTAGLVLAAEGRIDYRTFLFANVGDDSEYPDTLIYVRDVAIPYATAHGIDLHELTGKQTLYGRLMNPESRSVGIPVYMSGNGAPGHRQCTTDFKVRRVASWTKRHGATVENPATVALGISLDEFQRARTDSGIAWQRLAYPLLDLLLDKVSCQQIIAKAGLPLPPKSACLWCPYRPMSYWRRLRDERPELFTRSVVLEQTLNERRARLGKDPVWLTRKLIPLTQAVGDAVQTEMDFDACESGYCFT